MNYIEYLLGKQFPQSKLNLPKAQTGLQQLEGYIDSWLGYPQVQARKIAVNAGIRGGGKDDEFADSVRHANAGRLTAAQLQSKISNYVPNFVSAPLAFAGANALGIGHELSTLLGDKRPWSEKLREAGEDIYNNSYGAKLGALGDPKGQEKIEDAWINNRLPDGQVWTNNSGNGYMMSNGEKGFYKDVDKKTQLNLSAKRKLENLNQVQRDGTFIKPKLKTGGCLPKYQTAGKTNKTNKTNKKDKVNQDDKKPVYSWNSFITSNANVVTPKEIGTSVTTDSKESIEYNKLENRKAREAQERKDRIAAANAMQKSGKQFDSTENYAIANSAIGDKLRFSAEPNIVDDYLNPFAMIGDMASGLATVPDNLKKGNYGQAALAVAAPLATGALASIGANNTGQFVNNLINPLPDIKLKKLEAPKNLDNFLKKLDEKTLKPNYLNEGVLTSAKTIEKEGRKILNDLSSKEGIRRLSNQFKKANPNLTESELNTLVQNRLKEVEFAIEYNDPRYLFQEKAKDILTPEVVREFYPKNNAYWTKNNSFIKNKNLKGNLSNVGYENIDYSEFWPNTGTKKFLDSNYSPGALTLGENLEKNIKALDHEIGHATAKGGTLPIDDELKKLIPPGQKRSLLEKVFNPLSKESINDKNYFDFANNRAVENERYPFLVEQRRHMMENGILSNRYDKVTPKKLLQARISAMLDRGPNYVEGNRLIKFTPFWKYSQLADIMNQAPAALPAGLTGAGLLKAMQSINKGEEKPQMAKGGILNKKSDWEIIE